MLEHEPTTVSPVEQAQLQQRDHQLKAVERPYGNQQVLLWHKRSGKVEGASDPRGIGQTQLFSPWPDSKKPVD